MFPFQPMETVAVVMGMGMEMAIDPLEDMVFVVDGHYTNKASCYIVGPIVPKTRKKVRT